jgi:alanine-glyoxylate transaminase / (R)-3-amino-2-methylpropionate-pyruvate transaminase
LVSCRAALATLAFHQRQQLGQRSSVLGSRLLNQLHDLQERHPVLAEVRGRGLMVGVELRDSATCPAQALTDGVLEYMKDAGFLLGKTGVGRNVLTLMPPLVVTQDALDTVIDALDRALLDAG